ncbi:MFS transporter [Acetobacter fallax]|uniref:MFS transporter n=1 Tax=Acetobacter fallax TaxID=1737473 RepID=A0ABX0K4K9_9PROT|nr:MFS transporter [Acetobacter fallax]NHO31261.1 MFS transporter [Acetobacter fallax]NHO34818.1 MFS transporter [Acetobacter fallax]
MSETDSAMAAVVRDDGPDTSPDELFRRAAFRIVPFIFVCYLFNYLDRVNVGFAKLQMLDALGLDDRQYGFAAGIFFLGYVACGVPSNLMLEKFGARRWIALIMVIWGALSASLAFVHGATSFYAIRFLTGAAEAGFFPGLVLYLTRWFPSQHRGRVMALFMAAIPLSGVIGGPLSGWILSSFSNAGGHTVSGLAAWQWLFLLQGVPTVLLGCAVIFLLSEDVASAAWLEKPERDAMQVALAADRKTPTTTGAGTLSQALRSPWIWAMGLVYFCVQSGVYAINFWLPTIIQASFGSGMLAIGWLSAIPYLIAIIVMLAVGRSADRSRERRLHLGGPMLLAATGLFISSLTGLVGAQPSLALFGLSLGASGALTGLAMFWPLASSFLGAEAAAGGLALINSMGQIAGFASPWIVGWIRQATGSTDYALILLAVVMLGGTSIVLCSPRAEVPT